MPKRKLSQIKVSLTLVVLIILSVASAVAVYWLQTEDPSVYASTFIINAGAVETNFSQTGNLARNNPGMEKNTWYLLYEEPGQPAISAKLIFSDTSACQLSAKEVKCQSAKLYIGQKVTVFGKFNSGNVAVDKITPAK